MKRFLIPFLAFVLCPPTQAFGTVSCDGPNSGFISAGSQKVCLRKLTAVEFKAEQEMWAARRFRNKRQKEINAAEQARDAAEKNMDAIGERILEPGGQSAYRRALDDYIDKPVDLDQLKSPAF